MGALLLSHMNLYLFLLPLSVFSQLLSSESGENDKAGIQISKEVFDKMEEIGIAKCFTSHRKSPININISNITMTTFPPLVMKNYEKHEMVVETEVSNFTATINGYNKWLDRPTLSGGPLHGEYQLVEVHWDMFDLYVRDYGYGIHYGHTVGNAKYDFELHFVHTLNGLPLEKAKLLPQGVVIVATFVSEVAMTPLEMRKFFEDNGVADRGSLEELMMISNVTGVPFEWVPPKQFIPDDYNVYFAYNGTFSHPPCEGEVLWILMPTALKMSQVEMSLYLHAHHGYKHSVTMFSQGLGLKLDDKAPPEVFLNFPNKSKPRAMKLTMTFDNNGHKEVLGGIGAALMALVAAVFIIALVYRYYGNKEKNYDVNFNVGFDNVNFISPGV